MATVLDLITDAFVSVGEVAAGETIAAEDASYGMQRLNAMLDSWSMDRLYIPFVATNRYALTALKGNYSIGQTGTTDIAAPRPIAIENAAILLQAGTGFTRHRLDVITQEEYAKIADQGATANTPERIWCDYNYPNSALILWPTPTCPVATQLELVTWAPVSQFTSINTTLTLPPGYYPGLMWNLCVEIMPGYDIPPNPVVQMKADEGKRRIAALNMQRLPPAMQQQIAALQQPPTQAPAQQ